MDHPFLGCFAVYGNSAGDLCDWIAALRPPNRHRLGTINRGTSIPRHPRATSALVSARHSSGFTLVSAVYSTGGEALGCFCHEVCDALSRGCVQSLFLAFRYWCAVVLSSRPSEKPRSMEAAGGFFIGVGGPTCTLRVVRTDACQHKPRWMGARAECAADPPRFVCSDVEQSPEPHLPCALVRRWIHVASTVRYNSLALRISVCLAGTAYFTHGCGFGSLSANDRTLSFRVPSGFSVAGRCGARHSSEVFPSVGSGGSGNCPAVLIRRDPLLRS